MNYMEHIRTPILNHPPNHTENGLSPSDVITLQRLIKLFYQFTNLPQERSEKVINIGYTYAFDNVEFTLFVLEKWVEWKDSVLDMMEEGTPEYADELALRCFNFPEYKLVLSGKIKEQFYKDYPVFSYLYLTSQVDRDYFTGINSRKEEEVVNGYLKAVAESIKMEIPILNRFFFETKLPVNIRLSTLHLHSYLLGSSGTGKSTLIKNMVYSLQRNSQKTKKESICLIEPHGDLSTQVISFCLNKGNYAKSRLIYLDPFIRNTAQILFGEDIIKGDYTFTLNPFDIGLNPSDELVTYFTDELSSAFFEIMGSEASQQMLAVFDACIDVLLRKEGASISDLRRLMDNDRNDDLIAFGKQTNNEVAATMMDKIKHDGKLKVTTGSIYYKLTSLINNMAFRRMTVGKSTIHLEKEVNAGKVLIFNLSKSKLGKKAAPAFGKLVMALLMGIAIKRQDLPEEKRMRTYCFVDEFQNYVSPTIEEFTSETRKYNFHLLLANQVVSQKMDKAVRRAIFSNTGLKFAGANDKDSIEAMAKEMDMKAERFKTLPKYSFFMHDKLNDKRTVTTVRVPDFLVNKKSPFYMKPKQLKDVFKWLAYDSRYYKPVVKEEAISASTREENTNIYSPKFEE